MTDLLAFYRATWREGAPVLLVFPAVWIAAAVLEVMK
jgi:hypothetical protein